MPEEVWRLHQTADPQRKANGKRTKVSGAASSQLRATRSPSGRLAGRPAAAEVSLRGAIMPQPTQTPGQQHATNEASGQPFHHATGPAAAGTVQSAGTCAAAPDMMLLAQAAQQQQQQHCAQPRSLSQVVPPIQLSTTIPRTFAQQPTAMNSHCTPAMTSSNTAAGIHAALRILGQQAPSPAPAGSANPHQPARPQTPYPAIALSQPSLSLPPSSRHVMPSMELQVPRLCLATPHLPTTAAATSQTPSNPPGRVTFSSSQPQATDAGRADAHATVTIPVQPSTWSATRCLLASGEDWKLHEIIDGVSASFEVVCNLAPEQAPHMKVTCSNSSSTMSNVQLQGPVRLHASISALCPMNSVLRLLTIQASPPQPCARARCQQTEGALQMHTWAYNA